MSFETSLVASLATHVGLQALISGRLEPGMLPPETPLPAVVYLLVSDAPEQSGDGTVAGHDYHVQLSCLATTYLGVIALAVQANAALVAFAGSTYDLTLQSEQDVGAPDPDTGIYHRAIDAVFDSIPPATVTLFEAAVPASAVIVYEPADETPREQRRMETVINTSGTAVVYQRATGIETLAVRGRLLALSGAQLIATWEDAYTLLSHADRYGTTTTGWRVHTDPPPLVRHADEGTDWTLDMQIWRKT